ncbi:MAG: cytochrome c biogenesis protein ResB [Opitutaceae bacterium]|nr:cytochrome c biogenesis protein ResB [Opitutaceae bacterium]
MAESAKSPLDLVIRFFVSLKLTIACLAFGMILIFVGTLAQVEFGINQVLDMYFRSFVAIWRVPGTIVHVPLPGGFTIGTVLMINLIAAHFYRFRLSWKKSGIMLTHVGLITLLLGELFTALYARESAMRLTEGQTKTYSEAYRENEVAIIDRSDPEKDKTFAIPESALTPGAQLQVPQMTIRAEVRGYFANSTILSRSGQTPPADAVLATQGLGAGLFAREMPRVAKDTEGDRAVAWLELFGPQGSLGTWMVSNAFGQVQSFTLEGRPYTIEMRPRRFYKDFSLTLIDFRHDVYPGTTKARSFSSLVRLNDPQRGEDREVLIYMNHPLRYAGLTFFQQGYEGDKTTILQVVRNPSRHLPYIATAVVGLGLLVQFGISLLQFLERRKLPAPVAPPQP